jgi:hypothetical protein
MRKYQLLKETVLKITSHEWIKENLTLYEEIKKFEEISTNKR